MKKCSACGLKHDDDAVFCGGCGKTFINELPSESQTEETKKIIDVVDVTENRKKNGRAFFKYSLGLLLLILLLATTYFILTNSGVIGNIIKSEDLTNVTTTGETITQGITEPEKETETQDETETMNVIESLTEETTISFTTAQETTNTIASNYVVTVASDNLNLRNGPGTNYSSIAKIPNGTNLYISQVVSGWGYTQYTGLSGWVSMEFMRPI